MHEIFQQLEQLRHLPALDQEVCQAALSHMAQGLSRTLSLALPHMTARVFVEVHTPPATLIIVGASHVAIALYRAMHMTCWLPQAAAALAQVEAGCAPEGTVVKR